MQRRDLLLGLAASPLVARAQAAYPDLKPVRIVVPGVPGTAGDMIARLMADEFRKALGGTFIIDNRPGATGRIGVEYAAKAPADGYTLLQTSSGTHSAGPWLVARPNFDVIKDFTHIARVVTVPFILVVHPDVPARTAQEFVAYARRNKDVSFGYGSATAHVAGAAVAAASGFTALAVPYKGQPAALTDLVGGRVHYMMADPSVALPHAKAGRLRALAISTPERSAMLPELPTLRESGLPELDTEVWIGIGGPAGIPPEIVGKLNRTLEQMNGNPEMQAKMRSIGFESTVNSSSAHAAFVQRQLDAWGRSIRELEIPTE